MAEIVTTKIIFRKGPIADLPGQPLALFPTIWSDGLDEGEIAFAEDEGRVFIGTDANDLSVPINRISIPYRNIEILTENSFDAIETIYGKRMRQGNKADYHTASLSPSGLSWATVTTFAKLETSIFVKYSVLDAQGRRIRQGVQHVQYSQQDQQPSMIDEAEQYRLADSFDPAAAFVDIAFRYTIIGNQLIFQYRNNTAGTYVLYWNTSRPHN